jgi:hypothetical protein
MIKKMFLMIPLYAFLTIGLLYADSTYSVPPVGSTFTFQVTAKGDNGGRTPILEPMNVDSYTEIHTSKGIVNDFYPKGKKGEELTDYGPYDAFHVQITRPEVNNVITDFYFGVIDNSSTFLYQENSSGDRESFFEPEEAVIVHFPLKEGYTFTGKEFSFYLNLTKTGISIAPKYESPDYKHDKGQVKTTIDGMKTVATPAGEFECYPVTFVLTTNTGSFITQAQTTVTTTRCWAPKVNYYVTEDTHVVMKAMVNSDATIKKELQTYKLAQ